MSASSEFPVGMRVLVIDDDSTCLKVLEGLLLECQYKVTIASQATTGLNLLQEKRENFDIAIIDVHMPDMDGFKLLEIVGLEMDLPVIMMSVDDDVNNVMKGVTHGACDYLLKPIRLEELKNIWQHVVRKKSVTREKANASSNTTVCREQHMKEREIEDRTYETPSAKKKPRVNWNKELHENFISVVQKLGGEEKAVPKKILDAMHAPGLTRENVASHLQKYRSALKKGKCKVGDSYHRSKMISNNGERISNSALVPYEGQYSLMKNSYDGYRLGQCHNDQYYQKVQCATQNCDTYNQQFVANNHIYPLATNPPKQLSQSYMKVPQLLTTNSAMVDHTDYRRKLSGLSYQPSFVSPSSYVSQPSSVLQFPNLSTGCEPGPGVINNFSNVHLTAQHDSLHGVTSNFHSGYTENQNGYVHHGHPDGNISKQINEFGMDFPNEMMFLNSDDSPNLAEDPSMK